MQQRPFWFVRWALCMAVLVSCGSDRAEPPAAVAEENAMLPLPLPSAGAGGESAGSGGDAGAEAVAGASSAEQCPDGSKGAPTPCPAIELPPAPARCGDGMVNQASEECDGVVPSSAPVGSVCSVRCTIELPYAPQCGNGVIDLTEQCDGNVLPAGAPAGSGCSSICTLVPPGERSCGSCAATNCATQRADLDASLPAAEPLVECVLGASWQAGARAATESCGNGELFGACYCGALPVQDCSSAGAAAASGPCRAEILSATGCDPAATDSLCPLVNFLDPGNLNGKVMQYVQCQQDFCFEQCFNL